MIKPGLLRSTLLRAYSKLCDRNEPSDGLPSCDPLLSGIQARDWVLQRACYPQHSSRYCLALLRHIITPVTGNRGHLSLSHLLNACICFTPRLTRPYRYSLISAQANCVVMSLAAGYVKEHVRREKDRVRGIPKRQATITLLVDTSVKRTPRMLTIYTNHPGGNLVHKHMTRWESDPQQSTIQISWTDFKK